MPGPPVRLQRDIANGFVTPVPTLILYAAYTVNFLPALFAGYRGHAVLAIDLHDLGYFSFFVAKRHTRISRRELYIYICGSIPPGAVCMLGLYVLFA